MSDSALSFHHKYFGSHPLSVIPENTAQENDPNKENDHLNDDSFIFEVSTIDDYCHDATSIANLLDLHNNDVISINHIEEMLSIVPLEHRKNMGYFLLDCAKQNNKPDFPKSYLVQCILNATSANKFQMVQILKSVPKWKKPLKVIIVAKYFNKCPSAKKSSARNALTDHTKKFATTPVRCITPFSHSLKEKQKPKEITITLEGKRNSRLSLSKRTLQ